MSVLALRPARVPVASRAAVTAAVAVLAIAAAAAAAAMDLTGTEALVLLTAAVLTGPALIGAVRGRWDPFEPVVAFAVGWGVMFVVRTAAALHERRYDFHTWPTRHFDISGTLFEMQALALLGAVAFMAGYYLPIGARYARKVPAPPSRLHPDTAVVAAIGVGLFGMAAFAMFLFHSGGFHAIKVFFAGRNLEQVKFYRSSTAYAYFAPLLVVPATILLVTTARRLRDPLVLVVGLVFTAFLLIVYVPNGNRIFLLPLFGALLVYYYLARGRRPAAVTLLMVAAVGLVLSSILVLGRDKGGMTYPEAASHVARNPAAMLELITSSPDAEQAELFAAVLAEDPVGDRYRFGRATFGDTATRAIPRVLWHNKPLPPREEVIATMWPYEYRNGLANPEFSVLLSLYLDLQWMGVLLGMLAMGMLCRFAWAYFLAHRGSQLAQVGYAIFLTMMPMAIRDSPTDTFMKAVFLFGPIVAVVWVSRLRTPARRASAPPPGTF